MAEEVSTSYPPTRHAPTRAPEGSVRPTDTSRRSGVTIAIGIALLAIAVVAVLYALDIFVVNW